MPCCLSCHDMKDRFSFDEWPNEWLSCVIGDFPLMRRETRIFLARVLRVALVATQQIRERA